MCYWIHSGKRIIEDPGVRAVSSRRQVRSLPRFKSSADILKIVTNKDQIRNIGIIAHVDHGKTPMTDSLLAGPGLLSPSLPGTALAMDFIEEERTRRMTIKAAD